ncbi:MAG TPA: peptide deformylase [Thermodesulfobacteriota bacterium]|nr:peptide deformylase [Thermodesulfobacteriota bacterium]
MAALEILKYPAPLLKKKAATVERITPDIKRLISDMMETMYYARGIGLAANQVGVDKRVVVLDVPEIDMEKEEVAAEKKRFILKLINPEIVFLDGEIKYEEGCLSLPGITSEVRRAKDVVVRALDEEGNPVEIKATGLLAIALQHEVDHVNGMLFVDRLGRLKRELVLRKFRKAMEKERAL